MTKDTKTVIASIVAGIVIWIAMLGAMLWLIAFATGCENPSRVDTEVPFDTRSSRYQTNFGIDKYSGTARQLDIDLDGLRIRIERLERDGFQCLPSEASPSCLCPAAPPQR